MHVRWLTWHVIFLARTWPVTATSYVTEHDLKTSLLLGYDGAVRPARWAAEAAHTGPVCPVPSADVVTLTMEVTAVENVDQLELAYDVEGRMTATWTDARLAFAGTTQAGCTDQLSFDSVEAEPIWKPELMFHDAITSYIGNRGSAADRLAGNLERLEIQHDGTVTWLIRWHAKLRCPMHFGQLPYDVHNCAVVLGSFTHRADEVKLRWASAAPVSSSARNLTEWQVAVDSSNVTELQMHWGSSRAFSFVSVELSLQRIAYSYMWTYWFNSVLLVAVSYSGFWLKMDPGRVALSVISLMVAYTQLQSLKMTLPRIGYQMWLVNFLFRSILFQCLTFIVMALVNYGELNREKLAQEDHRLAEEGSRVAQMLAALGIRHPHWHFHHQRNRQPDDQTPARRGRQPRRVADHSGAGFSLEHATSVIDRSIGAQRGKALVQNASGRSQAWVQNGETPSPQRRANSGAPSALSPPPSPPPPVGAAYAVDQAGSPKQRKAEQANGTTLNGKGCKAAGQGIVAARRLLDVNNDGVVNKDDLIHVAGKTSWLWRTSVRNCQRIDQICRVIFPPLYVVFVLIMGSTYVKDSYR